MNSNFFGNTMIMVNGPYETYDYGFSFHHLDNFVSDIEIKNVITQYFYDNTASKKGYTAYFFAKNLLESINNEAINRWANFSEMYPETLEDLLTSLVGDFSNDQYQDLIDHVPFYRSPIISVSTESAAKYIYSGEDGAKTFFFPDEGGGLFTELAKLDLFDLKTLKKFAKSFGLPLGVDISAKTTSPDVRDIKKYNTLLYFGAAPISRIYAELIEYQNIFSMFVAVKTKNCQLANKINERRMLVNKISKIGGFSKFRKEEITRIKGEYQENISENNSDDLFSLSQCGKYLAEILSKKNAINSKIVDTVDNEFLEIKRFNNLFEIAYNQIKESLINNREIKKCEYCDHYFEPKHGKQRFCPPLPFRKRSSCENSYNQIKAKQKQN